MTDFTSAGNAADAIKNCVLSTKNLPGGTSAVVPPDPMPNSEVKRRSADGSVGSPHVRVGNCQASNKAESPVERRGFLFLRLKRTPSRKVRGLLLCGVYLPRWRCAYRGYGPVAFCRPHRYTTSPPVTPRNIIAPVIRQAFPRQIR